MKILIFVIISSLFLMACTSQSSEQTQETSQAQAVETEQPAEQTQSPKPEDSSSASSELEKPVIETAPQIVKTALITDGEHGVSATINLYSDNTLEVMNFNYDGKAPDTYVTVGNITDEKFEKVALVSEKISEAQENTNLIITLEEGLEFNAVSIYCSIFADDFGSAILEDVE